MYRFYWHPGCCSCAPMAVLEELGVQVEYHQVDFAGGEAGASEYRRRQPLGLVPALDFGDGRTMFESAAIVQYLCDSHREPDLAPTPNDPLRPRYLQWLYYMADTLYPSYNREAHPERYTTAPDGAADVAEQARRTEISQWQVVEDALTADGPWLLGERFSACDIYLQMITTWHDRPTDLFARFPHVEALARRVVSRAPCRRALELHQSDTGFEAEPTA